MHVIVNIRKEKEKQLRKWVLEDIIPQGLKDKIRQLQEEHQLAITDRDNQIQAFNTRMWDCKVKSGQKIKQSET